MSAPIASLDDEAPLPGWRHPLARYWAWRDRCEEHGSGPHLYQRWSRWVVLVDLVLNEWKLGFGWEDFGGHRYWDLQIGPFILSWSAGGTE